MALLSLLFSDPNCLLVPAEEKHYESLGFRQDEFLSWLVWASQSRKIAAPRLRLKWNTKTSRVIRAYGKNEKSEGPSDNNCPEDLFKATGDGSGAGAAVRYTFKSSSEVTLHPYSQKCHEKNQEKWRFTVKFNCFYQENLHIFSLKFY